MAAGLLAACGADEQSAETTQAPVESVSEVVEQSVPEQAELTAAGDAAEELAKATVEVDAETAAVEGVETETVVTEEAVAETTKVADAESAI